MKKQSNERKIKLAILTDTFAPWTTGGRESRFTELLPHLAARGMDITVYTTRMWKAPPIDREIESGYIRIRSICEPKPLYKRGRRSFFQPIAYSIGCLRLINKDFDVIETDSIPFLHLPSVWLVSKLRRKPLVIIWHEVWGKDYWSGHLGPLGRFGYLIERLSSHVGNVTIAVSRRTHRHLSEMGLDRRRLVLVENAVRPFGKIGDTEEFDLLFVGRLMPHKRPEMAIDLLEELHDLTLTLCIVGVGPLRTELQIKVDRGGLNRQVVFVEMASDEMLGGLMRRSRILLSPSEREGFGLVVAEALSLGTPVVTVDAPTNAAQDLVIDGVTGQICIAGSLVDFSSAVRTLIENPIPRHQVIEGWQSLNVPTSFEEVAKVLYQIHRRLVDSDLAPGI